MKWQLVRRRRDGAKGTANGHLIHALSGIICITLTTGQCAFQAKECASIVECFKITNFGDFLKVFHLALFVSWKSHGRRRRDSPARIGTNGSLPSSFSDKPDVRLSCVANCIVTRVYLEPAAVLRREGCRN